MSAADEAALRAAIDSALALHTRTTYLDDDDAVCAHCLIVTDNGHGHRPAPWPCPTWEALQPPRHWTEITPADARGIELPAPGIIGPVNEAGDPCPWPWEPQQLVGAPLGQYHCPYCGAMCVAGMPHPDYRGTDAP
jgi:hypothetical protein